MLSLINILIALSTQDAVIADSDSPYLLTSPPTTMKWEQLDSARAYTVSIQDGNRNHICTGSLITGNRILTTCKCVHVYDSVSESYECYDRRKHNRVAVGGVDHLCDEANPKYRQSFLFLAVSHPQCRYHPVVWFFDVGIYEAYDTFTTDIVPRPMRIIKSEGSSRSLPIINVYRFQMSPFCKFRDRVIFFSWNTFFPAKTINSLHVESAATCMLTYNYTLDPLHGELVYCSNPAHVDPEYRPCFGSEGAAGHFVSEEVAYLILSSVGNCSEERPVIWTRLDVLADFIQTYRLRELEDAPYDFCMKKHSDAPATQAGFEFILTGLLFISYVNIK